METAAKSGSDFQYLMTLRDGENGEGMKSQTQSPPERCGRWLGACACCRDYGLCFISIADPKEISPSKGNRQAVDHTANLHIWSTSEKQFPSN